MQNSGVTLVAESMHSSSAKDITPIYAHMSLMSSNFCPHLIFKFMDLIELSVLKD